MLEIHDDGAVRTVRMMHGKVSALDVELLDALSEAIEAAPRDGCGAVVLTGSGRAFSAGLDLQRLLDGGATYVRELLASMRRTFLAWFAAPLPVVAAVNGHAIAGGCILVAAADRRIGAPGTWRMGLSELEVGVAFPPSALAVVCCAFGDPVAARLAMSASLLDPDKALDAGLLDALVAPDELLPAALDEARRLAAFAPAAFAATKEQLRAPYMARMTGATDVEERIADLWASASTLRAIGAFVERTLRT